MGRLVDSTLNPSVIYATYAGGGKIIAPSTEVSQAIRSIGVNRIMVGHQPIGDSPLIIGTSDDNTTTQIICNDTSYSKNVLWSRSQQPLKDTDSQQSSGDVVPYLELLQSTSSDKDEWKSLSDSQINTILASNLSEQSDSFDSHFTNHPNPYPWPLPPSDSTRGITVAEILIRNNASLSKESDISIEGTLSNGETYYFELNDERVAAYLGKQVSCC